MAHTPGPWQTWGYSVTSADDLTVCTFADSDYNSQQDAANALLIAAAPDLLDAAKRLVALADTKFGWQVPTLEDVSVARAAIAKAEGGE